MNKNAKFINLSGRAKGMNFYESTDGVYTTLVKDSALSHLPIIAEHIAQKTFKKTALRVSEHEALDLLRKLRIGHPGYFYQQNPFMEIYRSGYTTLYDWQKKIIDHENFSSDKQLHQAGIAKDALKIIKNLENGLEIMVDEAVYLTIAIAHQFGVKISADLRPRVDNGFATFTRPEIDNNVPNVRQEDIMLLLLYVRSEKAEKSNEKVIGSSYVDRAKWPKRNVCSTYNFSMSLIEDLLKNYVISPREYEILFAAIAYEQIEF